MQTRRNFLKGLLTAVAAAALVKNGVIRPGRAIAEPRPWTIDMAANIWRDQKLHYWAQAENWPRLPPRLLFEYSGTGIVAFHLSAVASLARAVGINVGDQVYVSFEPDAQPTIIGRAVRVGEANGICEVELRLPGA